MEALFWLIIIIIWIFSALAKKKERRSRQKEEPTSGIEEKILEALGIQLPKVPVPEEALTVEIPQKKKKIPAPFKPELKEEETKRTEILPATPVGEPEPEKADFLSAVELEEGIIFSEILGPPKAYQALPRWWNGIHVGLKNR